MSKDFLRDRLTAVSLVPPGRYLVKLLPKGIDAFKTEKTSGVACRLEILEGDCAGRFVELRFMFDGPRTFVARDLSVLEKWANAVDAKPADSPIRVIAEIGRASADRRVFLSFVHDPGLHGTVTILAVAVEVEPLAQKAEHP